MLASPSTPRRIVLCEVQQVLTSLRQNKRFAVGAQHLYSDTPQSSSSSSSAGGFGTGSSSSSGRGGGGGDSGGGGGGGGAGGLLPRPSPLLTGLRALRSRIRQCESDEEFAAAVGAGAIVAPFLAVIRSEETSGEVTGAAVSKAGAIREDKGR